MTNSYDVDHGLSQDAPGPLEPVEIAQQDDTLARTGNTARDQEMYAAGIAVGEENAKHNAAIRAGAGWLPIESAPKDELILVGPTKRMGICVAMNHTRDGWVTETCNEWSNIYTPTHWMPLPSEPGAAPGVSTVEDERQAFEAWAEDQGFVLDCDFFEVSGQYYDQDDTQLAYDIWRAARASVAAPAAGDAQVLAALKQAHMALIGFMPQHRNAVIVNAIVAAREAIDAAIAAQRKGDA